MPSQRICDILDRVRSVHQRLLERYQALNHVTHDEEVQLLLADLERRESTFIGCLEGFKVEGSRQVLESWLQFVPEEVIRLEEFTSQLPPAESVEGLVNEVIEVNRSLQGAYRALADCCDLPKVRELFENLAQWEENLDKHLSKVLLQ
jgi:hypothetical protein